MDLEEDMVPPQPPEPEDPFAPITDPQTVRRFVEEHVTDQSIRSYILHDLESPHNGSRNIVKEAFGHQGTTLPSIGETYFHLLVARFLLSLTESQKEQFYTIARLIQYHTNLRSRKRRCQEDGAEDPEEEEQATDIFSTGTTRIPFTRAQFREAYLTQSRSILKALPIPTVHQSAHDTFAYSRYKDTMQHYFLMGKLPMDLGAYVEMEPNAPAAYVELVSKANMF